MTSTDDLRAHLVRELDSADVLTDPAWRAPFAAVPRHPFVPYFFVAHPDRPGWALVEEPAEEWLTGVYSLAALVTQVGGDDSNAEAARRGERVDGAPTSSSSAPALMALMLHALDVRNGDRVLEIGTGTGYNAALLSERLGADHVTSVDVDAGLVERARVRLSRLGYAPALAAVDGAKGLPDLAPYDRVVATVGLRVVPTAWIEQTRPGGVILLPLDHFGRGGLLARLTVVDPARAEGRFLPDYGGFMPLRANQSDPAQTILRTVDPDDYEGRTTELPADAVTDSRQPFEFFVALTTIGGGWGSVGFTPSDGGAAETWLAQDDGSWVCHVTDGGTHIVKQGGPRRLWDEIESAHAQWTELGKPARERFGLTVSNGEHVAWLDGRSGDHRWTLASQ